MSNLLNNPVLNEFVYTALFKASLEEKRGLKGKYLRIAMNGKAAKTFSTKSSREEKEYVLSHLGFSCFYVICKQGLSMIKFKEILDKFEKKKRVSAIADIAEEGIFVTSDKELIRLLGLMSQSIHHHSYFLNLELVRQGYHIQKWSKKYVNKEDVATREADASAKLLARTCLSATMALEIWPGLTGMTPLQIRLLLYLYSVSNSYISHERLVDVFAGLSTTFRFSPDLRALVLDQYVIKHGKEYTISAMGVNKVNEFINRTINLNNF